ncbi:hypothetical protein ABEB36_008616 [Hypothenemus hampei]|uniref:Uncharacterized protein n=1 Tax=Hypothenemus hampei TaxID=57062 RepID=A0ABD1EMH3_HYPHA
MLIATPYRDFDLIERSPPKIIAEVRKNFISSTTVISLRPKLSADLLVKNPTDEKWFESKVQVMGGQLQVLSAVPLAKSPIRIPLRHLSLKVDSITLSLSVCRGQNIVLTLQIKDEKAFDIWVKTLAIELIRQTPLDAIKYLDILTFAEYWNRKDDNNYTKNNTSMDIRESIKEQNTQPIVLSNKNSYNNKNWKDNREINNPANAVETLMKKCQNVENYVPVKEKLFLFESLCKMGRKIRSSENVSIKNEITTKKAQSCHDLSSISKQISVREICKRFENTKS